MRLPHLQQLALPCCHGAAVSGSDMQLQVAPRKPSPKVYLWPSWTVYCLAGRYMTRQRSQMYCLRRG